MKNLTKDQGKKLLPAKKVKDILQYLNSYLDQMGYKATEYILPETEVFKKELTP